MRTDKEKLMGMPLSGHIWVKKFIAEKGDQISDIIERTFSELLESNPGDIIEITPHVLLGDTLSEDMPTRNAQIETATGLLKKWIRMPEVHVALDQSLNSQTEMTPTSLEPKVYYDSYNGQTIITIPVLNFDKDRPGLRVFVTKSEEKPSSSNPQNQQ